MRALLSAGLKERALLKLHQFQKLKLFDDEYGISPGQACVFYSKDNFGDKVLGGGWISKN